MSLSDARSILNNYGYTCSSFNASYSCSAIATCDYSWDSNTDDESSEPELPWQSVPKYTGWCGSTAVTAYTGEVPFEQRAWRQAPTPIYIPNDVQANDEEYEKEQEENMTQYAVTNDYYNPTPQVEHSYIDDYMNKETEISKLVQQYNELIE